MSQFDEHGRPMQTPQPDGQPTYPGNQGGTNWYSPSFSQRTGLFYVSAWEDYASIYAPAPAQYKEGTNFGGGGPRGFSAVPGAPGLGRSPINTWTEAAGHGAVIALDPASGQEKWKFKMTDVTDSGILTTGSDLLFTGGREGYFQALDARTGSLPVEDQSWSGHQQRPDHLSRRQSAVRLPCVRALAIRVRARRIASRAPAFSVVHSRRRGQVITRDDYRLLATTRLPADSSCSPPSPSADSRARV